MSRVLLLMLVVGLALGGSTASALRLPGAPRCTVFPKSNPWNQRVDSLPVAANSAQIVNSIGAGTGLHADFGSGLWEGAPIGIPITVVGRRQAKSRVSFDYADESDRGPYPIPRNVKIEGGRSSTGDRHALIVDRSSCRLYELYALYPKRARLACRLGRDLEPALEQAPPGGLDFGGRGRPAHPPRPGPLRRGQARSDRPCAALHR